MLQNIKKASWYTLYFVIIFNILFIQNLTDGTQTTNVFIAMSFAISILVIAFFTFFNFLLKKLSIKGNLLSDILILYLVSELAFFCLGEGPALWGILYKFHFYDGTGDADILQWREQTRFVFSVSCLIAAILYLIQRLIFRKQVQPISEP
ncbi:MAG TPA: hypothetical protein VNX40_14325 [Mucilaginibacter sp.]|nr:hypothetical protein [Mucilaginibacter sp.]